MKLLFEEIASRCFKPSERRIKKLKKWIIESESAREKGILEARPNQYDKAEELITFYTFAPFFLNSNQASLINRILKYSGIVASVDIVVSASLERLIPPPIGYLSWIQGQVKDHPIKYIREQAITRKNENKLLEGSTHADAYIETEELLILFEMKFTSDISYCTTFNPFRNQLARLIDVGLEVAKSKEKRLVVFFSAPSSLYESKSRLYLYKIKEYSDPLMIERDIAWRPFDHIKNYFLAVKWIALEELIDLLYNNFNHPDKEAALKFFKERNFA